MIKEQIISDLKSAMKNADQFRLGVLRLLSSAMQNESIALRGKGESEELTDENVIAVLKKEAKKRKESIAMYGDAGRNDLKENEEKELAVIKEYLPPELSDEEIKNVIEPIIAAGDRDFASVMKSAMAEFKGRADGKVVSEMIRSLLS
ncbi:MAG: GatB/YqeY domain-containing protein [Candidatus Colwellbacteria bacterium]|nr:GatB/YqeY domain-containing protein [Candidatus Colwellbacteria bacterium]